MSRYVVDASIAVAWFFEDEDSDVASAALDLFKKGAQVAAPAILWFELHNAILFGVRRQRLPENSAAALLVQISRTTIQYFPAPVDGIDIFLLAHKHRLTFYDACYLELAQREHLPLATLDKALVVAAKTERIALIGA